jgi:hypothetical protein
MLIAAMTALAAAGAAYAGDLIARSRTSNADAASASAAMTESGIAVAIADRDHQAVADKPREHDEVQRQHSARAQRPGRGHASRR